MIILDTNIVSEPGRPNPNDVVMSWLNAQDASTLYLASPTIAELAMGAEKVLARTGSAKYANRLTLLIGDYSERILSFELKAAMSYGKIISLREGMGRPILVMDAMIAAICIVHGARLATRNVRDFDGLDLGLVNPFEAMA
ncbi:type II toxin-antitoxin system VapC family toxin [Aminobacter sp. Piv2-1]|uniref:type II toxin-antitoxin system VapC family toxin n=1 Tax=Aminobacter sp. Piv2-1 TaxID=3031122 RepID=UPI0030958C5A